LTYLKSKVMTGYCRGFTSNLHTVGIVEGSFLYF